MKKHIYSIAIAALLIFLSLLLNGCGVQEGVYERYPLHNPDGIGKLYMGREIAKVMGHQEILWLERPSRQIEEQPNRVIAALDIKPNDVVADIGAGSGYFSFRIASKVSKGKVLAVDIQPEMLDLIKFLKHENNLSNIETILGTVKDPHLPENTVDIALMVDTYHELEYPREMMKAIFKALKPGGKVVLVEYKRENPLIAIKTLHKMSQKQAKKEMAAVGLHWIETKNFLPSQHLMFFQK